MKSITYTAAHRNFASILGQVCNERAPVVITRRRNQSVVLMSLADYRQSEETAYLLSGAVNAQRLLAAVMSLETRVTSPTPR